MSNQPFFTIGLPVYNTARWVGDCLDSILNQGFEDMEIICVDDGSTDNSLEVLGSYAAKDSRIKIISRENGGVSRARNTIFYNAQGRYIYVIDSDDTMCENVLPRIYDLLCKNNFPDVLHTCCARKTNGEFFPYSWTYPGDECFDESLTKDERVVMMWLNRGFSIFSATKFIRREFLHRSGVTFSHEYTAFEDSDFSFQLYRKIDSIAYTDIQSFIYYLPREGSASAKWSAKYFRSMLTQWKNFYYNIQFWALSDNIRSKVKDKETEFYRQYRDYPLTVFSELSKDEALEAVGIIEELFGKKIKQLPAGKGINGVFHILFRIIGMQKTSALLYHYLKLKGVIKN